MASGVNFGSQQYFGFNPLTVPNCQLWLDAADTTTTLQTFSISYNAFVTTTAATVTYSGTLTSVNNFYGGTVVMNGTNIGVPSGSTATAGLWAPSATSGRWYSYVIDGGYCKTVLCEFVLTGAVLTVRGISAGYTATGANYLSSNSSGSTNDTRYATYTGAVIATSSGVGNYGVQSFVMNTGGDIGTSVGLWKDKSVNGANAVANTAITYNANGLGTTYPALTFTSSQWLSGPISITGTTMTIFCAYSMSSASPFAARVLALAAPETNDYNNTGYVGILRQSSSAMGPYRNGTYTSSSTPYSTRLFTTTYFDGTNQYTSTNGGTFASNASSGSFAVTSYRVANNTNTGDTGAAALYGFVGEILVYNTALTTSQRHQVEGYLAWKWGVQSSLPITHSFKRNSPAMRLFQPVDVLECAIWVDPADRSSILALSGDQPTSIRSKGHQTITLDNAQPTNNAGPGSPWTAWPPPGVTNYGTVFMTNTSSNLNTLRFTRTIGSGGVYGNGYNGSYLRVPAVTFSNQQRSFFFVHSPQSTGIDSYAHIFSPTVWSGLRQRAYHDYGQTAYIQFPLSTGASTQTLVAGAVAPYTGFQLTDGTPYIFGLRHTTSTTSNYASVNGLSQTPITNQALTTGYATGTDEYALGIFFAYTRQFIMGDFLLYDGAIQEFEIRQIEGYLAWKWGLRTSLPIAHPFRNFPPATALFAPPFLSNLAFWIDAADPSTVTSNGSSVVTQVLDKGPNARNLTNTLTTNGFTWNVTKFNGIYPSFYYNSTQNVTLGSNSSFTISQPATVFTVQQVVGSAINQDPFDSTNSGNRMFGFYFINAGTANYRIYAGATLAPAGAPSTFNPVVTSQYFNGATSQIFENGTSTVSGDAGTQGSTGITIGSRFTQNTETFQGHIAEVIYYSRRLSESERRRVEGYLAWKWGFQDRLPVAHPYYKFRP